MVVLDGLKFFTPENGRHQIPLSKVSTVAIFASSNVRVALTLVDPDGELRPCGSIPPFSMELHKLELRNFHGLFLEAVPVEETDDWHFQLHLDVRHAVGEPISDVPMSHAVSTPRQISERERTRRTVLQTLQTLNVMPSEDDLEALEATLGFDFEADEFGDYLEADPELVDDDEPDPKPSDPPDDPPAPTEPPQSDP